MAASILQQIIDFVLEPAAVSIALTIPLALVIVWLSWSDQSRPAPPGRVVLHGLALSVLALLLLIAGVALTIRLGNPLWRYGGFLAIILGWALYCLSMKRRWAVALTGGIFYTAGLFLIDEFVTVLLLFE